MQNNKIIVFLSIFSIFLLVVTGFLIAERSSEEGEVPTKASIGIPEPAPEPEPQENDRDVYTFDPASVQYFSDNINQSFVNGYVLESHKFTYNDIEGEVFHLCQSPVLQSLSNGLVCLGTSHLMMKYNNTFEIIDSVEVEGIQSIRQLFEVVMLEASNTLLISFDNDSFRFAGLAGIRVNSPTHAVMFEEDPRYRELNVNIERFSFRNMVWNPSGTKSVMIQRGDEGGGYPDLIGYDLELDVATTLIDNNDLENYSVLRDEETGQLRPPALTDIIWLDDDTVEILGEEFTF